MMKQIYIKIEWMDKLLVPKLDGLHKRVGKGNVGDLDFVMGMKTTKFTKLPNKKKTRAWLVPTLDHEIKKKE